MKEKYIVLSEKNLRNIVDRIKEETVNVASSVVDDLDESVEVRDVISLLHEAQDECLDDNFIRKLKHEITEDSSFN